MAIEDRKIRLRSLTGQTLTSEWCRLKNYHYDKDLNQPLMWEKLEEMSDID